MYFEHADDIWRDFPELVPGVLFVEGVTGDANVEPHVERFVASARARLETDSEGALPEVRAWRRAFSRMGLEPTQYRSASEALLRRFRKESVLARIHPLVDVCNAISLAYAIPIAAFDTSKLEGHLEVRRATGDEGFLTFSGETERPPPGEVIFADAGGRAHARRWTNRQSGFSAVHDNTSAVLVVAEAMHVGAAADVRRLVADIAHVLTSAWAATITSDVLEPSSRRFRFEPSEGARRAGRDA